MKHVLEKGTVLFINVLVCLFASCSLSPPEPVPPQPPGIIVEPPIPGQGSVSPSTSTSVKIVKILTQGWNTYVTDRKTEGYKLLDVRKSAAWLQQNKQEISMNTGSNYQYNIRSVTILTTTYTTQEGNREDKVLIVNDDAGNLRVFQK